MKMEFKVQVGSDDVPFIDLGKHKLRLELEELEDDFYKEKARLELRETTEVVEKAVAELNAMIKEEPNLDVPRDEKTFLLKFLRPCKFYPASAFKLMQRYYKFRTEHPIYTTDLTPDSVRKVFDQEVFQILPTRSAAGCRMLVINAGTKWSTKEVSLKDLIRAVMVAIEIAMLEPKTQVSGVHVIINVQGMTLTHLYQFSPSTAKLIVDWVQDCAPIRLKGIHIINQPFIFDMVYALFKPFLREKLKKRIFFHGSSRKGLCEAISVASLPSTFGGTADYPEFPGKLFSEMMYYYQLDFKRYSSYGYVVDKA